MSSLESVKQCLSLDFKVLHPVLEAGLEMEIEPRAVLMLTCAVEATCQVLMEKAIMLMEKQHFSRTKLLLRPLQLALHQVSAFRKLMDTLPSLRLMSKHFLTREIAAELCALGVLEREEFEEKLVDQDREPEEDERDPDEGAEWQRRRDDPFSDAEFAGILKCVHPAFTLSYESTILLSCFVRELLNGFCEQIQSQARPLVFQDIDPAICHVCADPLLQTKFRQLWQFVHAKSQGTAIALDSGLLTLKFCRQNPPGYGPKTIKQVHVKQATSTSLSSVFDYMEKKFHLPAEPSVFLYRGQALEKHTKTRSVPFMNNSIIYVVPKKWWMHRRRDEARRGMLSSVKLNEQQGKQVKTKPQSKLETPSLTTRDSSESPAADAAFQAAGITYFDELARQNLQLLARVSHQKKTWTDLETEMKETHVRLKKAHFHVEQTLQTGNVDAWYHTLENQHRQMHHRLQTKTQELQTHQHQVLEQVEIFKTLLLQVHKLRKLVPSREQEQMHLDR